MIFQNSRIFRAIVAGCFLFGCVFSAFAQNKSKKTEKIDLSPLEIKANVLALNSAGLQINNVKAEDLKIFENGVEQKLTSFVRKESFLNVGFVIDNSASLRPNFEKIIKIGKVLAANLRASDQAFVVRFVSSDKIEVVQDWTTDKEILEETFEDRMFIEPGQSAVVDRLYLSAEKIVERAASDKTARGAIVIVTDGDDRDSFYKLEEALAVAKNSDVQIFLITLTKDLKAKAARRAEVLVHTAALKTGGRAFVLNTFSDDAMTAALQSLIVELRSQYIIGYTSTNPNRDGQTRNLTVQIADNPAGEKQQAFIRESFVVPQN